MGPSSRTPFFPRAAGGGTAASRRAEGAAVAVGDLVVNQACQQKEKAQKTRCQWRRIA